VDYGASYNLAGIAFQRAMGAVYFIAFMVAAQQFPALHGKNGIEPVTERLSRGSFWQSPSIFRLYYSDRFFGGVAILAIVLSVAATIGITDAGPLWLSLGVWGLLWILYLSIVNIGGTFYGFGWESKLLDAGFLAIFMGPAWMTKPVIIIFLIRWLLFRIELGAGLIKMRGDPCWRKLTCMSYHHETQPVPNALSRFFHNSPAWVHRVETLGNHVVQLGIVWFIFGPQPIAAVAGALVIISQLWLVQSGNYSWLNCLTIVIALPTVSDGVLQDVFRITPAPSSDAPAWFEIVTYGVAGLTALLSIGPIRNLLSKKQLMNHSYNAFHLVNTYGAFGSVTKVRHEVIIQGTDAAELDGTTQWREYEFKAKPGALDRRPRQVAPYHFRLDWQLWFVPLRPWGYPRWFLSFIRKLLEGDPAVLRLMGKNPFPDAPPRHIRVLMYRYHFTTRREHQRSGHYWKRQYESEYLPAVNRDTCKLIGRAEKSFGG
jgi:hypothetical protein